MCWDFATGSASLKRFIGKLAPGPPAVNAPDGRDLFAVWTDGGPCVVPRSFGRECPGNGLRCAFEGAHSLAEAANRRQRATPVTRTGPDARGVEVLPFSTSPSPGRIAARTEHCHRRLWTTPSDIGHDEITSCRSTRVWRRMAGGARSPQTGPASFRRVGAPVRRPSPSPVAGRRSPPGGGSPPRGVRARRAPPTPLHDKGGGQVPQSGQDPGLQIRVDADPAQRQVDGRPCRKPARAATPAATR